MNSTSQQVQKRALLCPRGAGRQGKLEEPETRLIGISHSLRGSRRRRRLQADAVEADDAVFVLLAGLGGGVGVAHFGEGRGGRVAVAVLLEDGAAEIGGDGFFGEVREFLAVAFDDETGEAAPIPWR